MFYPDNDLPCAACAVVRFHAVDDSSSAGFLECDFGRIAVQYTHGPQPYLTAFPPLRLIDDIDAGCSFLDACLEESDERYFSFEFNPLDGQVSWRRDLVSSDPEEIDAALREMRRFFQDCWPWLENTVARCGTAPRLSGFRRLIRKIMEV